MTQEQDRTERQGWLEALRPDQVTRARLRAAILERAAPLLAERREEGWLGVAAGWSARLAPVAAAAALLFGWLAYDAGRSTQPEPAASVRAETLVEPGDQVPPELLTSGDAPSADRVLAAALQRGAGR